MANSQTSSVTTAGPALFTHDGYQLYVFDGVPCMLDTDLGQRLKMVEAKAVRRLIKRHETNLMMTGNLGHGVPNLYSCLRRRPLKREPGKTGRPGVAYYLT